MSACNVRALQIEDGEACDAAIASLPHFFGDPVGVRDCAEAVRTQRGFVAEVEGQVVAFLTLLRHFPESDEITWMAVHAEHRHGGIGRRLIGAAVAECASEGVRVISVLTLGPSVPDPGEDTYEGTRAFYHAMGFVPLRELGLREWNNAFALILARPLG